MDNQVNNYCEKILNNYLENIYLELMSIFNSSDIVVKIIYRAFEKLFLVDFDYINFLLVKDKFVENIMSQMKKYPISLKSEKGCNIDKRIYLFNFNLASYFNDLDNKIIVCIIAHKMELSKISELLGYEEEFIKNRFLSIIRWMKVHFINVIKPIFIDENKNELD